jgi:hypothetical protein
MIANRSIFQATAALMLVIALGCQNTAAPGSQATATPPHVIVVNYPKGGGTTIFLPPPAGSSDPVVLCSAGTTVCPECKAAAARYFATGVLDAKCPLTGGSRSVMDYVPSNGAHN